MPLGCELAAGSGAQRSGHGPVGGISAWTWQVHSPGDPDREPVEDFIRAVYARRHAARVRHFMPELVSLRQGPALVAAAGYRQATEPLFLERYLDGPVHEVLSRQTGCALERCQLVEVGHLAASEVGAGRRLIHVLGAHLAQRGVEWVVSTLTEELRHLFLRMGVTPLELAPADPQRLGPDAQDWGRYYEHRPMVLAGHLPTALGRMHTRPVAESLS